MQTIQAKQLLGRLSGNRYRFGEYGEYEITIARTLEDRKRAWTMVYRAYLEKGYAKPDQDKLWYGMYDALPQTTTFIVTRDGKDVATVTTVFDSEIGLPADQLYRDEMDLLRNRGRRLCEVISLACEETDRRRGIEVLKHLFKVGYHMACKLVDATDFIITVNPHHAAYYEKKLLFRRQGEERFYGKVNGAPAVLLVLDLLAASDTYMEHYGPDEGSIWHHFFEPLALGETVSFLAENVAYDGRTELLRWFEAKRPEIVETLKRAERPFDAVYEMQTVCAAACGDVLSKVVRYH
jgi:hypothetical protein